MRILHDHGFSDDEMQKQRGVIYNNTVQAMAQILRGMQQLNITFDDPSLESEQRIVLDTVKRGEEGEPFRYKFNLGLGGYNLLLGVSCSAYGTCGQKNFAPKVI